MELPKFLSNSTSSSFRALMRGDFISRRRTSRCCNNDCIYTLVLQKVVFHKGRYCNDVWRTEDPKSNMMQASCFEHNRFEMNMQRRERLLIPEPPGCFPMACILRFTLNFCAQPFTSRSQAHTKPTETTRSKSGTFITRDRRATKPLRKY